MLNFICHVSLNYFKCMRLPGRVAQSVTCLTTDASLTADPGVVSSIPARSHTFVEFDHEIISTALLLLPGPGKVWLGELTVPQ